MMKIGDFIKTIHFRYNNQPVNIHVVSKLEHEDLMKLEDAAEFSEIDYLSEFSFIWDGMLPLKSF